MSLKSPIKLALLLWLIAETVIFVLVAKLIGVPLTLLLGLLTSVIGWTLLKRAGMSAVTKLRAAFDGRLIDENRRDVLDHTLTGLGAVALLMPGFLSDLAGLPLLVPAVRARCARWIATKRFTASLGPNGSNARRRTSTIDLEPGEWERTGSVPRSGSHS